MRIDFSCQGKLRLWAKLYFFLFIGEIYFRWWRLKVLPSAGLLRVPSWICSKGTCQVPTLSVQNRTSSVRREQWRFTLGPCACGQRTPPLCSSPSPRTPDKLPCDSDACGRLGNNDKNNDPCQQASLETMCLHVLFQSEAESRHFFSILSPVFLSFYNCTPPQAWRSDHPQREALPLLCPPHLWASCLTSPCHRTWHLESTHLHNDWIGVARTVAFAGSWDEVCESEAGLNSLRSQGWSWTLHPLASPFSGASLQV